MGEMLFSIFIMINSWANISEDHVKYCDKRMVLLENELIKCELNTLKPCQTAGRMHCLDYYSDCLIESYRNWIDAFYLNCHKQEQVEDVCLNACLQYFDSGKCFKLCDIKNYFKSPADNCLQGSCP